MNDPDIIIEKMQRVSGGIYWTTLGKKNIKV